MPENPWDKYAKGHPTKDALFECENCNGIVGQENHRACTCGASLCSWCDRDHDCRGTVCAHCRRPGGLPYLALTSMARLEGMCAGSGMYLHNKCADNVRTCLKLMEGERRG